MLSAITATKPGLCPVTLVKTILKVVCWRNMRTPKQPTLMALFFIPAAVTRANCLSILDHRCMVSFNWFLPLRRFNVFRMQLTHHREQSIQSSDTDKLHHTSLWISFQAKCAPTGDVYIDGCAEYYSVSVTKTIVCYS
jgi:hypothetical protein